MTSTPLALPSDGNTQIGFRVRERDCPVSSHLRLGIFTPNYPGVSGDGGIGTYTQALSRGLTRQGHSVHVLTIGTRETVNDDGIIVHSANAHYLPLIDRGLPGAGACLRLGRAMQRIVREHSLDVVEFPNWGGNAIYYAARRTVPLVVRMHTSARESQRIDGTPNNHEHRFDVRRERWSALMADALVTHSEAHRATMAQELGVDAERIEVIPHGIDMSERPAIERDPHAVVFLGRLETRKGPLDLLNAVPAILKAAPDAQFYFIGADRPLCPGGRTHAQYLRDEYPHEVQSRVALLGRLPSDEVDRWLQRASVFVAPSIYESFGLILLEAMRWGTPVVSTRVGGIPEVVEDGVSGILVPPASPGELAKAIISLLRDPERRRQMGENGLQRCRSRFTVDKMATRVAESYRVAIERWSRR